MQGLETLVITMLHNKEDEEKKLMKQTRRNYNLRNALAEKESDCATTKI